MPIFRSRQSLRGREIDPHEIFLDSANLPKFNDQQFEGRLESPIPKRTGLVIGLSYLTVILLFLWQVAELQIVKGEAYFNRSQSNSLKRYPVFPERALVYDRENIPLVWNAPERAYFKKEGLAHLLGYLGRPTEEDIEKGLADSQEEYIGKDGVEKAFNFSLRGEQGLKIAEVDTRGKIQSENVYRLPRVSRSLTLSVDVEITHALYTYIKELSAERGFSGGAGVIMDVRSGEILALTSFPEFDPKLLTEGKDIQGIKKITADKRKPFLNRAVAGLYTPGSIVKPYVALAALAEKVIDPETEIVSTGSISVANPYDKTKKSVFTDWKAHGAVDMRRALAVSSNVYFYEVGGGFEKQKGVGIRNIEKYAKLFGLGEKSGIELENEAKGVVPSPEWKEVNFKGDAWRVGDTYNTAIGQYGFQVTALQMARAVAAISQDGILVRPTILKKEIDDGPEKISLGLDAKFFKIVKEGMRQAVREGTAQGLSGLGVTVGAKTGTAELGTAKQVVNSWVTGFFPYENPRYSFAVVMEKGRRSNTVGGVFVMRQLLDWMGIYKSEYLKEQVDI